MLVDLALLGWPLVTLVAFLMLRPRAAILVCYLGGIMLLPNASIPISGFVDYNKTTAMAFSGLLGIAVFDSQRLTSFKPHLFDLPMLLYCVMPMVTILQVGLAFKMGVTIVSTEVFKWAVPYFIGRLYFCDREGRRDLALGILLGVLFYVPFALYEIRMAPTLHYKIYGYSSFGFGAALRGGSYRPVVFMQGGLMLGLWIAVGGMAGIAFWLSRGVRTVMSLPMPLLALGTAATSVLCKSIGAIGLLFMTTLVLFEGKILRTKFLLWGLVLGPPYFAFARISGIWDGDFLISLAEMVSEERAISISFRILMEDYLFEAVGERSLLGRGPIGFLNYTNDYGEPASAVVDSLWIIRYARFGIIGLALLGCIFLIPMLTVIPKIRPQSFLDRRYVCTVVLVLTLVMFWVDCVLNAMVNPAYPITMGALTGYGAALRSRSS
jgi:hypothetical protein